MKQASIAEVSTPDLGEVPVDVHELIDFTLAAAENASAEAFAYGVAAIAQWLSEQDVAGWDEVLAMLQRASTIPHERVIQVLQRIRQALSESVH